MDQKVDMLASTKRLQNRQQQIKFRTMLRTILHSKQKDVNRLKDKFNWLKKF